MLTDPRNRRAQVKTEDGQEIPCTALPAWNPPQVGATFRADVTREGSKAVSAVWKSWT